MWMDAGLAYAHFAAILGMVVFITSQAALCRSEWLNAAAVERLRRVDLIYRWALAAVALTGAARLAWGVKGAAVFMHMPLFHLKVVLFLVIVAMAVAPMRAYARWQALGAAGGGLPAAEEVNAVRRQVMRAAHLMLLLPLAAVLMSRGLGVFGG